VLGEVLYEEFHPHGYKPTRKKMAFCTAKIGSWFIPEAKSVLYHWGKRIDVSNKKAKEVLKIDFINYKKSIIDMGYDLIEKGYVPDRRTK
jgi:hypothetical protein